MNRARGGNSGLFDSKPLGATICIGNFMQDRQTQLPNSAEELENDFHPDSLGLGMILRDAYFSLRRCSNAHCAPLDCNGDQFVLLKLLSDREGLTQSELVREAGYDASTTTNMLKRLESKGMVVRCPDPADARAKLVYLTKKGRTHQLLLWRNSEELRRRIWECLPEQDRETVANGLRRIATEMQTLKSSLES